MHSFSMIYIKNYFLADLANNIIPNIYEIVGKGFHSVQKFKFSEIIKN